MGLLLVCWTQAKQWSYNHQFWLLLNTDTQNKTKKGLTDSCYPQYTSTCPRRGDWLCLNHKTKGQQKEVENYCGAVAIGKPRLRTSANTHCLFSRSIILQRIVVCSFTYCLFSKDLFAALLFTLLVFRRIRIFGSLTWRHTEKNEQASTNS